MFVGVLVVSLIGPAHAQDCPDAAPLVGRAEREVEHFYLSEAQ